MVDQRSSLTSSTTITTPTTSGGICYGTNPVSTGMYPGAAAIISDTLP